MKFLLTRILNNLSTEDTDTTIYAFNKIIYLMAACNPNVIELGGLKPEHYLYIHPIGQEILDNAHMFYLKGQFIHLVVMPRNN